MNNADLQTVVTTEAMILGLVAILIISSFRRWKILICLSSVVATIAVFSVWAAFMALGSVLVYGPASLLLWFELDKQTDLAHDIKRRFMRGVCWTLLAIGVALLIGKNIYNIYGYLN